MPSWKQGRPHGDPGFCALHHCHSSCCNQCKRRLAPDGTVRPHLLYLHVEKTGGSSLECATQNTLIPLGAWSNMGHVTNQDDVRHCMSHCTFDGVAPQKVVSVRNPYAFARSMYAYTWSCAWSDWCKRGYQPWMEFEEFIKSAWQPGGHATQSESIRRACGDPCVYDHLLRAESLEDDWIDLMIKTDNTVWRLPHANPTEFGPMGPPPRTVFTKAVTDIIERTEARLFTEFGYQKRTPPFELGQEGPHHLAPGAT
jgi:hypothetical protein